jgi:hypothetical protein
MLIMLMRMGLSAPHLLAAVVMALGANPQHGTGLDRSSRSRSLEMMSQKRENVPFGNLSTVIGFSFLRDTRYVRRKGKLKGDERC